MNSITSCVCTHNNCLASFPGSQLAQHETCWEHFTSVVEDKNVFDVIEDKVEANIEQALYSVLEMTLRG